MRLTLTLLLSFLVLQGFGDVWRKAADFPAPGVSWGWLADLDSPQGAWHAAPGAVSNTVTADLTIGQTLPAGDYVFFLKCLDYDRFWDLHMSAGGSAWVTNYLSDREDKYDNLYWSGPMVFTAVSSFTNVSLVMSNEVALAGLKARLFGFYISTNTSAQMTRYDKLFSFVYPSTNSYDNTIENKNFVPNGSFEAGMRRGVSFGGNYRKQGFWETLDTTPANAHSGSNSMVMWVSTNKAFEFHTAATMVKSNRFYTFGAWVKSTAPLASNLLISVSLNAAYPNPSGSNNWSTNKSFFVGQTWTWCSVGTRIPEYPVPEVNGVLAITGYAGVNENNTVTNWIDDVVLTDSASPSNYIAEAPLAFAMHTGRPGNVFRTDETVIVPLKLHNATTNSIYGTVHTKVYDGHGGLVSSADHLYSLAADGRDTKQVSVPSVPDSYNVIAWDNNNGGKGDELQVQVLYPPRGVPASQSRFGLHPDYTRFSFTLMTNMAVQWSRAMSPAGFFYWLYTEPTKGNFVWYDQELALSTSMGIKTLGTLRQTQPTFAVRTFFRTTGTSGVFSATEMVSSSSATGYVAKVLVGTNFTGNALLLSNVTGAFSASQSVTGITSGATATVSGTSYSTTLGLDMWGNYCSNVVAHYAGVVDDWESCNEPQLDNSTMAGADPHFYSEVLRESVIAIRAANSNATIAALGGSTIVAWSQTVISNMLTIGFTNIDFGFHWYPGNESSAFTSVQIVKTNAALANRKVYNTESGATDFGGYSFFGSTHRREGVSVEGFRDADRWYRGYGFDASRISRNHIESLGWMDRVYTYDFRMSENEGDDYGSAWSILEGDDSISKKGVALATLVHFLDGSTSLGRCASNAAYFAHTFNLADTNSVVAMTTIAWTNVWRVTLPGGFPEYKLYNLYGRPVATNAATIDVTHEPLFLVSTNAAASIHTNFAVASWSVVADTVAPTPIVTEFPTGISALNTQWLPIRWMAVDNLGKPEDYAYADRLQYSVKITPRDSDFGAWTTFGQENLAGLSPGDYVIYVKAKDLAGNESQTSQPFYVGAEGAVGNATAVTVRALNFIK